jgi:Galactosyltransferase
MNPSSTLVLVLAARVEPYPALVRTIKRTWSSVAVDGIETLFYFGGAELSRSGPDLTLPVSDDLQHTGEKTLACFEHALATRDPALIFRTNCSSYVDLPNLSSFVRANARSRGFYAGRVGTHATIRFASGSGYFLSRDVAELVLERRDEWDHSLLDDVALGALLGRYGVEPEEAPRQDLASMTDLEQLDLSEFHFRCKSARGSRRDDAALLLGVHRAFRRTRGAPLTLRARIEAEMMLDRARRRLRGRGAV